MPTKADSEARLFLEMSRLLPHRDTSFLARPFVTIAEPSEMRLARGASPTGAGLVRVGATPHGRNKAALKRLDNSRTDTSEQLFNCPAVAVVSVKQWYQLSSLRVVGRFSQGPA